MRGETHYQFAEIQYGISRKGTRSYYNERTKNETSSSSYDYEMTPKVRKNSRKIFNAKFDIFMKTRCDLIIEGDNELF